MNKKTILLVGSEGYIGSMLTDDLTKKYNVIGIDALIYKGQKKVNKNPQFIFKKKNLNSFQNKDLLKILSKVDHIIYLAGLVGDPITKKYKAKGIYNNETVILNFIKKCKKYFKGDKFIFISTCSNYGLRKNNNFANEKSKLKPLSSYAKSKVKLEKFLLNLKKIDFNPVILRFATAFGYSKRMRFDLTINAFIRDAYLKKEIVIYDQHTWRPYCHTKDFSRLIIKTLKAKTNLVKFQVFNAGGHRNNFTKRMIANIIQSKIKDTKLKILRGDFDKRNYRVSFKKLQKVLKFKPKYTLNYCIDELIQMFQKGKYRDSFSRFEKYGNYHLK